MTPRKPRSVFRRGFTPLLALLCSCAELVFAAPAQATVVVDLPLDDLIRKADLVVRGRVLRTGTRVRAPRSAAAPLAPRTHVWIEIHEVLAGEAPREGIVHLWELGGSYADVQTTVAGTPHYERGENVLVFLAFDAEDRSLYRTLEMVQGKYRVVEQTAGGEPLAVRDMSDVAIARWRRKRLEVSPPPADKPIALQRLAARVRALRLNLENRKELGR